MARYRGIYKRGNIFWVRYAGPDGKMLFESSMSPSFRDAQTLLIKRRKEVVEGKTPIPLKRIANHTFKELAEHYLNWAERQRAIKSKKSFVKIMLAHFGDLPLRSFNTRLIEEYQTGILADGKKPATANRHLAMLKHMFTKAVDWEMVEDEVLKKVRALKLLKENNKRLRYLSTEECQTLIQACSDHLKPIVITALNSGMRKEEILSLEWERNIDLKHGFIHLDNTKNGERREIPINQTLRGALQSVGFVRRLDSPYVFIDKFGHRYKDVKRSFHSACRRAKIFNMRFHDLRHTFASHLTMQGVNLATVKELLGHKSINMTLRYAHLAPEHNRKAVQILDAALNQRSEATAKQSELMAIQN